MQVWTLYQRYSLRYKNWSGKWSWVLFTITKTLFSDFVIFSSLVSKPIFSIHWFRALHTYELALLELNDNLQLSFSFFSCPFIIYHYISCFLFYKARNSFIANEIHRSITHSDKSFWASKFPWKIPSVICLLKHA